MPLCAASPTVGVAPTLSLTKPVVPPSPTFEPVPAVWPSSCRSNRPASELGRSVLFTLTCGIFVLVNWQTTWCPSVTERLSFAPGVTGLPLSVQASELV